MSDAIDGVDVHVDGEGADTIVMVHGWPDTHRLWDGTVAALKDRYRCVRFTLPGFDAAGTRRAYTLDEVAEFLRRVVEAVSPGRKVTLLLHDWGCIFGYHFYVKNPALVSRIVGVDIGDVPSARRALSLRGSMIVLAYQLWLASAWMIGGRTGDRMTQGMARGMRCPTDPAQIRSSMTYPYYMTWIARAGSYRRAMQPFDPACPMLYIYAQRKPVHFHAQSWLDAIGAREGNAVVPFDCGHWVMIEQPRKFHEVVRGWLDRTPA